MLLQSLVSFQALLIADDMHGFNLKLSSMHLILASWFAFVDVDEDQLIDRDELQQFFMTQLELNGEYLSVPLSTTKDIQLPVIKIYSK